MNRDEIRRQIEISPERSVCVSLANAPEYPGYVRAIYLRPENRVMIEYNVHGLDEGGVCYEGRYASLDAALNALAEFLHIENDEWMDFLMLGTYPEKVPGVAGDEGHEALRRAVQGRRVPLPPGATFVAKGSSYWLPEEIE
ncbi:MAG TPA: hypothetical protein VFS43_04100 [Polyangiaceae bacterium]|nr:hypothetical protein [Polyangiaceae bacterium]